MNGHLNFVVGIKQKQLIICPLGGRTPPMLQYFASISDDRRGLHPGFVTVPSERSGAVCSSDHRAENKSLECQEAIGALHAATVHGYRRDHTTAPGTPYTRDRPRFLGGGGGEGLARR